MNSRRSVRSSGLPGRAPMDRSASAVKVLASDAGRRAVASNDTGTLIRLAREALGWTQLDLGRRAGYSQPTISRLEKNGGRISEIETRSRLADVLGIPRSAVGLTGDAVEHPPGRTVS